MTNCHDCLFLRIFIVILPLNMNHSRICTIIIKPFLTLSCCQCFLTQGCPQTSVAADFTDYCCVTCRLYSWKFLKITNMMIMVILRPRFQIYQLLKFQVTTLYTFYICISLHPCVPHYAWECHDTDMLSSFLLYFVEEITSHWSHKPFVRGIHWSPVDSSHKGPVMCTFDVVHCCYPEQALEQAVKLLLVRDTMTLMRCHCHGHCRLHSQNILHTCPLFVVMHSTMRQIAIQNSLARHFLCIPWYLEFCYCGPQRVLSNL